MWKLRFGVIRKSLKILYSAGEQIVVRRHLELIRSCHLFFTRCPCSDLEEQILEGWRRGGYQLEKMPQGEGVGGDQLDSTAQMNRSSRGEAGGVLISSFRIALVFTEVQILYDRTAMWSSAFQKEGWRRGGGTN